MYVIYRLRITTKGLIRQEGVRNENKISIFLSQACFTGATTCYFSLAAALPHSSEASFSFNGRLSKEPTPPEVSRHHQTVRFITLPPHSRNISLQNNHPQRSEVLPLPASPRRSLSTSLLQVADHSIFSSLLWRVLLPHRRILR